MIDICKFKPTEDVYFSIKCLHCNNLISVLLWILYFPPLYIIFSQFWVEMYSDKNCVCFNSIFSFWQRQGGRGIPELKLVTSSTLGSF